VHGSLSGKLWSKRGESRRRSFKLERVRLGGIPELCFWEWSLEVGLQLLS
jgi:hypothetical protein